MRIHDWVPFFFIPPLDVDGPPDAVAAAAEFCRLWEWMRGAGHAAHNPHAAALIALHQIGDDEISCLIACAHERS